jgi:signal transduction histidine kinase
MRMRIAVSMSAALLLLILGQAIALLMTYEEMEQDFIDEILAGQLAYSIEVSRHSPELALPNTPTMKLYRLVSGEPLPAALPPALADLPIGNHEFREGDREYQVGVREANGSRFILVYDWSETEAREIALGTVIIVSALVLSVLVMILVYAIAGRLTLGLESLAARVLEGGRDAPLSQPGMEQELLAVAQALDAAETRQAELLTRERDFSANLSHELRTPLAGIRSDAEMLATNEALPNTVRRRAERIIAATDSTTQLAESLLLLAREARPQLLEAVSVADAIRSAWGGIQSQSTKPVKLELHIPGSAVLQADPALLQLVLRNLLANALRHGEGMGVSCVLEGSRLSVQDRGPGLPEGDPDQIFQRFHRRGQKPGHGLGLALVKHICTACGWSVRAFNRPGGGASIEVDFGVVTVR